MANIGGSNPLVHPLQATMQAIGAAGGDPRLAQKMSDFQGANEGPAEIAAKISGVNTGKRQDDSTYFTNNEGIPFPDP